MRAPAPLLALGLLLPGAAASARTLDITDASSSSTYPDQEGVSYAAKNLKDKKQATAWFEGDDGSGLGSTVELSLSGSQAVTGFRIWNGYWLTYDMWQRNNRVKTLQVVTAEGEEFSFDLADEMKPQEVRFPKPVTTSKLTFRIKGVHNGNTFNDTAISELQLFDDAPAAQVAVSAYAASSVYPEDADGDYEADNLGDGVLDSMWCEGDKAGDGTGQWVEFTFGSATRVSQLELVNGNAFGFSSFMNANSATAGTLTFSDGSTQTIAIKPSLVPQTIAFSPKTTSSVRLTFTEVRKGKEFNDLCISEAGLLP